MTTLKYPLRNSRKGNQCICICVFLIMRVIADTLVFVTILLGSTEQIALEIVAVETQSKGYCAEGRARQ